MLDLLDLPVPEEGAQALVAFFDAHDRLTEMLLLYRARVSDYYPEAGDLALQLENRSLPPSPQPLSPAAGRGAGVRGREKVPVCAARTYPLGGMLCRVTVVSQNSAVGALVHLACEKPAGQTPTLSRNFGAINLDRSFEQNRLRIAPEQRADTIQTDRPAALNQITSPCGTLRPQMAILCRQTGCDLTDSLTLRYGIEETTLPLYQVAMPLWVAWGAGALTGADDQHGGHLGLIWEDAQTHYELSSPYITGQLLEFTVRHRSGLGNPDQRAAQVKALDQAERAARINSGKPLIRLPRYLELDQIRLGMSRDQVVPALPVGQAIIKQTIPGGISVTFAGEPARNLNYVARQMFLRFDAKDAPGRDSLPLRGRFG